MKVLISIKPKYCELIANGRKTIEVRKTKPKLETPFKCYIYCTLSGSNEFFKDVCGGDVAKWNRSGIALKKGKVIGEFVCDKIVDIDYGTEEGVYFDGKYQKGFETNGNGNNPTCLSFVDLENYLPNGEGYGWHISELKIYDKPKELLEFIKPCENDLYCEECAMFRIFEDKCGNSALQIKRPPQSWCYVTM